MQVKFTPLIKCCCNSNSALHERDCRISQLAFAVAWKGNAAKLSSLGIWLNASKLQSLKESYGNYLWLILGNKNRVNFVVPKFHCTELEKNQWYAAVIKSVTFRDKSYTDNLNMKSRVTFVPRPSEIEPMFDL